MKKPIKLAVRSFAASLAIITALAASSAWAGWVWTGAGNGYWNSNNYNTSGNTGGTGMFFRSGVNDTSGNEIVVNSWDAHFNNSASFGYAFNVDRGTSSEVPATLAADADSNGITVNNFLNVGTAGSDYGDGYLWVKNGTYSFNGVYIGQNAANPASSGYLTIGSSDRATTFASKGDFVIRNGEVTAENATITVNGKLVMDDVNGSTATFYNRGGNLVVTNDLTVQNRGSGEFYMEGGHVTVSNIVRFGEWTVPANGTANLYLNGGVFEAKTFRFHNSSGPYGYVVFNGGTYKAMADGSMALNTGNTSTDGRLGAVDRLYFKVGERGGTIDTAWHDVVFPLRLLKDGSSTGGLCVKGGGSLTLENANVTYTGKTCIEAGTTLVVSNSTVKSNILLQGLELAGAPTVGTSYTIFRCNDNLTNDDLANVTCGAASDFTPAVGEDGKSIVVTATALKSGYWTGAKDNNLSDSANWTDGNVPTSGNAEICCSVATTLTVGGTFSPDTITIPDGSALVTIGSGTLCVNEVVNRQFLAVGAGATVVIGDQLTLAAGESLCDQNNGTLVVSNLLLKAESRDRFVTEHQKASSSGIFKFNAVTNSMTGNWFYFTDKSAAATNEFYIGEGGLTFQAASGSAGYAIGRNTGDSITIRPWYSNFTIADRTNANHSLILMRNVTFCTDDENGEGRTITINAKTRGQYSPVVTVSGKGRLQVNGTCNNANQPPLTVTESATLAFGAGASLGTGAITLGAGTTLALTSTSNTFTPLANMLNLPTGENEVATVRIDGMRLKSGDHEIATVGNEATTANVALDSDGKAIDGRRASLRVEDGKLKLNIQPGGLTVIIR